MWCLGISLWPAGPPLSAPCTLPARNKFSSGNKLLWRILYLRRKVVQFPVLRRDSITFLWRARTHALLFFFFFPLYAFFHLSENVTCRNIAFTGWFLQSFSHSEPAEKSSFAVTKTTHIDALNHKKMQPSDIWAKFSDYRIVNICLRKHPISLPAQKTFILWKMSNFMKGIPFYLLFSLSLSGPCAVDIFLLDQ